jgi:hypothetical protein
MRTITELKEKLGEHGEPTEHGKRIRGSTIPTSYRAFKTRTELDGIMPYAAESPHHSRKWTHHATPDQYKTLSRQYGIQYSSYGNNEMTLFTTTQRQQRQTDSEI